MNINIGNTFSPNRYNSYNRDARTSDGFPFILSQNNSITGSAPGWTAKDWDVFMEDFAKGYSDEQFAAKLQIGCDRKISTEKKINWQATGENELTQDQIDYLKATYDIENMDGQDYYNLIADLTNMNVISGKDTAKQHAGVLPIGVVRHSAYSVGESACGNGEFSMFSGNIYQNFLGRAGNISHTLNLFNSSNPLGSAKEYLDFKDYFEQESRTYGILLNIFDKIVR